MEAVAQADFGAGVVVERAEAGVDHFLDGEAVGAGEAVERAAQVGVVADLEALDDLGGEGALLEVGARGGGPGGLQQAAVEKGGGLGVDLQQALGAGRTAVVLAHRDGYAALVGQVADGVDERHAVVLHEELEDVAVLAAAEAVVALALDVDVEGRRLLVVEGAACHEAAARALERKTVADHGHDVGPAADVLDDGFGDDGHGGSGDS